MTSELFSEGSKGVPEHISKLIAEICVILQDKKDLDDRLEKILEIEYGYDEEGYPIYVEKTGIFTQLSRYLPHYWGITDFVLLPNGKVLAFSEEWPGVGVYDDMDVVESLIQEDIKRRDESQRDEEELYELLHSK